MKSVFGTDHYRSFSLAVAILTGLAAAAGAADLTWDADPGDWGDNGVGTRTYDVLRDGTPIAVGLAYGTTSYTDTTGTNGQTYTYILDHLGTVLALVGPTASGKTSLSLALAERMDVEIIADSIFQNPHINPRFPLAHAHGSAEVAD